MKEIKIITEANDKTTNKIIQLPRKSKLGGYYDWGLEDGLLETGPLDFGKLGFGEFVSQ
jgi:hypothetical protein